MRALTFGGKTSIRLETVDEPGLVHDEDAIVRVELSAICGSDLHVYHGRERGLDRGTVMGHEFVGSVVETGRRVRGLSRGQRVLSPFSTSCGACFYCMHGLTARCERGELFGWVAGGRGLHGAQAEYVRVPLAAQTLVPIPDGVLPEEGLLLGDVISTGYFCAQMAGVRPGDETYVVLGCGPVGLMGIVGARELGAQKIYAVDSVSERLELARRFGAIPIDLSSDNPPALIREATAGRGADAVLELVGSPAAGRLAIDCVRPGGTVAVVGVHNEPHFAFTPAEAYDKNLTLRVGRCPARSILESLIPMVQSRRHPLSQIISHRLPLDRGVEAYSIFDQKRDGCTKVVLTP